MKILVLFTLCLITGAPILKAREFTDVQGRKLDAELISVAGGQATMKRASDGRSFVVPVASWSAEDQKFMNEFAAANQKYSFEVRYTKKKMGETKQKSNDVTVEDERWIYKIEIKNRMPVVVSDLRVDYWCFRKADEGKGKGNARIEISGSSKVSSILGSSATTVETDEIIIHKEKLDGGFYYADGTKNQQADGFGGLAVRIFDKNDREVYKFATKDDLLAAAVGKPSTNGSKADK